jgi:hypothetical protein
MTWSATEMSSNNDSDDGSNAVAQIDYCYTPSINEPAGGTGNMTMPLGSILFGTQLCSGRGTCDDNQCVCSFGGFEGLK